jgi:hypothetical protein
VISDFPLCLHVLAHNSPSVPTLASELNCIKDDQFHLPASAHWDYCGQEHGGIMENHFIDIIAELRIIGTSLLILRRQGEIIDDMFSPYSHDE